MTFVIRKFNNEQTLGEKLKNMRGEVNLTLSEMATKTKIRKAYLKAFETGAYNKLPDPIYARNLLKTYVKTLGGEVSYFLDQFEHERGTCDFVKKARLPRQRASAFQLFVASKLVKVAILFVLVLGITSYIGFQVKTIIEPPTLMVHAPADGYLTKDATIIVSGQSDSGAHVTINGTPVLLSQDGSFEEEIVLERGTNVITIEGTKRYSRVATEYRRVVLEQDKSLSIAH